MDRENVCAALAYYIADDIKPVPTFETAVDLEHRSPQ